MTTYLKPTTSCTSTAGGPSTCASRRRSSITELTSEWMSELERVDLSLLVDTQPTNIDELMEAIKDFETVSSVDCLTQSGEDASDTSSFSDEDEFQEEWEDWEDGIDSYDDLEEKLFYACRLVNNRGLDVLKEHVNSDNVNTFRESLNNSTLLHAAASGNNIECLHYLLICGADVNAVDRNLGTPLHYACVRGANDAVRYLAFNNANLNAKDCQDRFPLLVAMKNKHIHVMKTLICCKADVTLKTRRGDTCLHIAAREGYEHRTLLLIREAKLSVNRLNSDHENVLFCGLKFPAITKIICDSVDYRTLFKMVSKINSFSQTVFHIAAHSGYLESILTIVQSLTTKSDESTELHDLLTQRLNEFDAHGLAPIHYAVRNYHSAVVKLLASSCQVNVNLKDQCLGNTALHYALLSNQTEVVRMLIELSNADPSIRNNEGETSESPVYKCSKLGFSPQEPKCFFSLKTHTLQLLARR